MPNYSLYSNVDTMNKKSSIISDLRHSVLSNATSVVSGETVPAPVSAHIHAPKPTTVPAAIDVAEEFQARRNRKSQTASASSSSSMIIETAAPVSYQPQETLPAPAETNKKRYSSSGAALVTSIFMSNKDNDIAPSRSDEFCERSASASGVQVTYAMTVEASLSPSKNSKDGHSDPDMDFSGIEAAATAAAKAVSAHISEASNVKNNAAMFVESSGPVVLPSQPSAVAVVKKPTNLVAGQSSFLDKAAPKTVVVRFDLNLHFPQPIIFADIFSTARIREG